MSRNIFIANEANGVSAYHSLINGNYKNISKAFSNTVKDNVRIEFKGRNVIAQHIGTDYYVSSYNYCPYFNSLVFSILVLNIFYYIRILTSCFLRYFLYTSKYNTVLLRHLK